ncbi:uncharacterized protein LOC101234877 [Hydra vulgaris]|uniref:uncharacterized protein LOC101234877 n=1 Tax=Hydra vulgaris TaxID=6087 RepID=UPI00064157C5|nr:uncharacterized protein LOC101234877 [Hydra vulgaris]
MDTLFTTFLSSTDFTVDISPIFVKKSKLNNLKSHKEMCLCNSNCEACIKPTKLHLTMEISDKQGVFSSINVSIPRKTNIVSNNNCKGTQNLITNFPLHHYFMHQIHHLSARRRFGVTLFAKETPCFCFGEKMENHHSMMCSLDDCCDIFAIKKMNTDKCCMCAVQFEKDRFCPLHEIYIQKTTKKKKSCSWFVCPSICASTNKNFPELSSDDECLTKDSPLDYFEIEFDATSYELEVNLNSYDNYNDKNFFFPDDENEEDENSDYENDDNEICFQSFEYEFNENHSSLKKCSKFQNHINDSIMTVAKSKYHRLCIPEKKAEENIQTLHDTKKVRFAETVVHHLYSWQYAYKESRSSYWVKLANDRAHFSRRTEKLAKILDPVLKNKIALIKRLS